EQTVDEFLANDNGIVVINQERIQARRLITPNERLIISNVSPCIPHSIIAEHLKNLGIHLITPIDFLRIGTSNPAFKHILSFRRYTFIAPTNLDNVPPSDLLLRLGEHDLSTESEPYLHQERRVQIVASHPQFDPRTFEYDLALLRFYEPVTFQPNILPVCVPQSDENFVGRTAYVTGWGRLYEDGPLPSVLQEVSVPVINNTVCESMYRAAGYIEHIPHIFICAGWRRGGFDSCEGDSGGPMVIQRQDNRFLLAGVISWGIGCAEPNQPGVYTRISEFRDWINQILQF
ncbi:serine proteinase stubble-like, partial [Diabrotica undecimpunctata]|uniref:serine proteinase stubble-like n=1 Tax=Diabrotica undecimpunctata TaxID=50387 RepID=UPI003B6377A9